MCSRRELPRGGRRWGLPVLVAAGLIGWACFANASERPPDPGLAAGGLIAEELAPGGGDRLVNLVRLAGEARERSELDRAENMYNVAYEAAQRSDPRSVVIADCLRGLGLVAYQRGDMRTARVYLERGLEEARNTGAETAGMAILLNDLGEVARLKGDYDRAAQLYGPAIGVLETVAPNGRKMAICLNNLGIAMDRRDELDAAVALYERALEILAEREDEEVLVAITLVNLGVVAWKRGDLKTAEERYRQSLEILERADPQSRYVAGALQNLGIVTQNRGDYGGARKLYRRALDLTERLAPDSLWVAGRYENIAVVLDLSGDLDGADENYRRSLAIRRREAPESAEVALTLGNLGILAMRKDDLDSAEEYLLEALSILERQAPEGLVITGCLNTLGTLARRRGRLDDAQRLFERALEIRQRQTVQAGDHTDALVNLGLVAMDRGNLDEAEALERRALSIVERQAPGSTPHAVALDHLGDVLRAAGRTGEALAAYRLALDALEQQQQRLGGTAEGLGEFREHHLEMYRDLVGLLVETDQAEEAFAVHERSRARSMLALLAERDLVTTDIPIELARERRLANVEHGRILEALRTLPASAGVDERRQRLSELAAAQRRQEEVRARIREASPRLASLRYPQPLGLKQAQALLEEGTLLLTWSLGSDSGILFVVATDGIAAHELDVGEKRVQAGIRSLRRRIAARLPVEGLTRPVNGPWRVLLGPAAAEIARSHRLILVPQGPLWQVPFSMLGSVVRPDSIMVEHVSLSQVVSATVLGQIVGQRTYSKPESVVALGDPTHSAGESAAFADGDELQPLPASRVEVEEIGALFEHSVVALGREATEARARAVGKGVDILHLACHGIIDEHLPLESGLVLATTAKTSAGDEDGLLQAWEVFEQVRLDADLVTLSACETALGEQVAGEGIVGLTRAFQYAGARSVLASLWSVADASTAELMRRFYTHLQAGESKDEALRQAQLAFVRGEVAGDRDLSHPFYWAAFQLYGDWQ